jgi:hypothetical protein
MGCGLSVDGLWIGCRWVVDWLYMGCGLAVDGLWIGFIWVMDWL